MNWRQILLAANLPEPPGRDDALKRVYERQRVQGASGFWTQDAETEGQPASLKQQSPQSFPRIEAFGRSMSFVVGASAFDAGTQD